MSPWPGRPPAGPEEMLLAYPAPGPPKQKPGLHLALFLITVVTTVVAGAILDGADIFSDPLLVLRGVPFALSLLLILGVHETAHYLASRRHGLLVTLPYFIPAPTIIGTMGAVIKIRSPIRNRRSLLDIGVSGPLAGFAVALPVTALGLGLSRVVPPSELEGEAISLGSSLLFNAMVGIFAPDASGGELVLHPVAFAGWVGLLVTAFNLMPIGQLDGGHIVCALFQRAHRFVSLGFLAALLPLGLLWPGWLIWAVLLVIIGWRHPPPADTRPLDTRRRLAGLVAMLVFLLTFTPVPFRFF